MVVVVMGVAGAGKSTVGRALAEALGWPFHDADAFHPTANVARMRRGEGLTDADREPWLAALERLLARLAAERTSAILACSALRRAHRNRLRAAGDDVRFVYLTIDPGTARQRLASRRGHFAGAAIVDGQFRDLEPPRDAIEVDATRPPQAIVEAVRDRLRPADR